MPTVRFAGAGAYVPSRTINNERIAKAFPGWSPERILEKTGIVERRYLWEIDEKGNAIAPPENDLPIYPANNTDMCEIALRKALGQSGVRPDELDAIFVVTCSPDELNFNHDAMELHRRLGCRVDTFALVVDDGCGGTPYIIDMAAKMMEGGRFKNVAVVASTLTSPHMNREVYTSEIIPGPGRSRSTRSCPRTSLETEPARSSSARTARRARASWPPCPATRTGIWSSAAAVAA